MKTVLEKLDTENIDERIIKKAGTILREGGLVAFPTETVYGLGGDALNPQSSQKIYVAKGRPSDNPLIVHIAKLEQLEDIAKDIPKDAYKMAEKFWPGPLTMILHKKSCVPKETTGGLETVAVRMPFHQGALKLIEESGGFIAAPSANRSGRPSPTKASHVIDDLYGLIDMILDGGQVGIGLESTIIDMSEEKPVILRPGFVTKKMLKEICSEIETDPGIGNNIGKEREPKAPGMKYRHYAPYGQLIVVEGEEKKVISTINYLVQERRMQGKRTGVLALEETKKAYVSDIVKSIGSRHNEEEIARSLFSALREFDELGVDFIYSEAFYTPHMGQAIMNRLLKAAGYTVVQAK